VAERKKKYKKWTDEALAKEAKKYNTRGEFLDKSPSAYMLAKRREILDDITKHMFNARFKWTKKMIEVEAKRYETRGEFLKGSRSAYSAAVRMEILEEVTAHMPRYAGKGKKRGPNKRTLAKAATG
jgi:hypothetical protein